MSRISIAMCTYNGGRFLPEQLASIAAQQRLPDEMVVCDDGSTDTTLEILEKFSRTVPFTVRIVRNPVNLGSTKNFEQAISLCTGDLIALCDQDDVWLPEKLAIQAEFFEHDPEVGGFFSNAYLIDENSNHLDKTLWQGVSFRPVDRLRWRTDHIDTVLLRKNVVTGATLMIRAETRPAIKPIPAGWVHDGWIAWMLAIHSVLIFQEEKLIKYRLHASQQIGVADIAEKGFKGLFVRLRHAASVEPAQHSAGARQLVDLERHIKAHNGKTEESCLLRLQEKIRFFEQRGHLERGRLFRAARIITNVRKYHWYECGWKVFARDILLVFI